ENLAKPSFDDSMLSPEEKKMVEDFAAKIDLGNSSVVLQYGAGAQKKIADFSETALGNVRTKDLGELGEMLSGVVSELKSMDAPEEEKGFLGIFKKTSNKITSLKAKYGKAEENITRICTVLEGHQIQLLKDVSMLDKMYQLNTSYFKELSMYILAGKKKLDTVRSTELPALIEKAQKSGLPEDAQAANDLSGLCNRFERKLHDLELTRTVSLQMAPQIRLVQSNDTLMSEKIQSTLVNTIPLWKSQILLALGVNHSQQAAEAQREVTDMTNQLLRQNAQTLKMATVATAKESERGIIDIETLKLTNESLISTLDEVMKIQEDGRARRRSAELELGRIETELKQKLLDIRK
ncbi:MAG: toxic anion resistance protein, partial [Angelakisella sp.]